MADTPVDLVPQFIEAHQVRKAANLLLRCIVATSGDVEIGAGVRSSIAAPDRAAASEARPLILIS